MSVLYNVQLTLAANTHSLSLTHTPALSLFLSLYSCCKTHTATHTTSIRHTHKHKHALSEGSVDFELVFWAQKWVKMIKLFSLKQQKKDEESAGGTRAGVGGKKASAAQLRIQKGTTTKQQQQQHTNTTKQSSISHSVRRERCFHFITSKLYAVFLWRRCEVEAALLACRANVYMTLSRIIPTRWFWNGFVF